MSAPALIFYFFAGTAVLGALGVVLNRNPMYCAISLLLSFVSVSALFFFRNAEFLGIVQLFVYGGGIMVLFLFVIMLVNLYQLRAHQIFAGHSRGAIVLVLLLAGVFAFLLVGVDFGPALTHPEAFRTAAGVTRGNSEAVAWTLYRDYLLPFEIASIFLLVAMMGAVILGRKQ